ncbi:Rossmann-fold NAD(P)-binding domain-containing protein [Sphingobacterium lumbrici]|uniref:lactate dehydrogenase n=1 Tax=Sphingobacterium lumbrici TaxID=2559600 RepID=UPI00112B49A1|nr:lactate dehydrogenase [Sphingobacterium lumbrici]
MKVVAYNIKEYEKELLAKANAKVHDLTLISNRLSFNTLHYAIGKDAIIISDQDTLDSQLLNELNRIGIKHIVTRSISTAHIDIVHAGFLELHVANTPFEDQSLKGIAEQVVLNLNQWSNSGCTGSACQCTMKCAKKEKFLKDERNRFKRADL